MRRAKAKSAGKRSRRPPKVESIPGTPVDIAQVRDQIRQAVGSQAIDMVNAAVKGVKSGHYLAMKYLFEIVGIYPASASAGSTEEDSLGKILLRNLGIDPEIAQAQTKVWNDSSKGWNPAAGDAVE
jgi:hypothetical protein